MLKEAIILVLALVGCNADVAQAPSQAVSCGVMPGKVYGCLGLHPIFSTDVVQKCKNTVTPCAKLVCLAKESGWVSADGKVDKKKAADFFDTYGSTNPKWSPAVTHLKVACLGDKPLPPQGTDLSCPVRDILHCALTSFLKMTPISQWQQTPECKSSRDYAANCPVCPEDCFATQVPNDSCHACYALPRSA